MQPSTSTTTLVSDSSRFMAGLSVLQLQFTVRAVDALAFGDQPGSALRGALYEALAAKFCGVGFAESTPEHRAVCPVCRLLAAEDDQAGRGRDLPRPLTIEPPLGMTTVAAGVTFTFGISLVGWAQGALLYVLRAMELVGRRGLGRGRSRLQVLEVKEASSLDGRERLLVQGRVVRQPQLCVTAAEVSQAAAQRIGSQPWQPLGLELLTPMRLTSGGHLVHKVDLAVLCQRLVERCQNLVEHCAIPAADVQPLPRTEWAQLHREIGAAARVVEITADNTYWVEARSGSRRQQRYTEIGGLVGSLELAGDTAPLLPWLLWGQCLHIGKDAVKGNGWFIVH